MNLDKYDLIELDFDDEGNPIPIYTIKDKH